MNRGQALFEKGISKENVAACVRCHGTSGQGKQQFPRLAGQHADYLVKQLKVFQRTDERPEGSTMKGIAHALSEENMEDVAAYLQAAGPK